jgi:ribosomal-protein-alanine N-acetyltransferase
MPNVIFTNRLILRHWRDEDTEPFIKINKDPEVMRFFPSTQSADETLALITRIQNHFNDYGYGAYAVERIDTGQFIGFTGFSHPSFKSHFTPCVEIGWRLGKEHWNQGFATEAAKACLNYGFENLGLNEIYSFTATLNLPSINVMEKAGLKKIGGFEHPAVADRHKLKTHVLYKIAKEAWFIPNE